MTAEQVRAEIVVEFEALQQVVTEPDGLRRDVDHREPTVREETAAAAFLAQFYTGIENTLKRLSRFHGVELPTGENWHLDLFKRFCSPACPPLPPLFDEALARQVGPFRRFRHVVHHGYGFRMDWDRMREGLEQVASIFATFRERVSAHLQSL